MNIHLVRTSVLSFGLIIAGAPAFAAEEIPPVTTGSGPSQADAGSLLQPNPAAGLQSSNDQSNGLVAPAGSPLQAGGATPEQVNQYLSGELVGETQGSTPVDEGGQDESEWLGILGPLLTLSLLLALLTYLLRTGRKRPAPVRSMVLPPAEAEAAGPEPTAPAEEGTSEPVAEAEPETSETVAEEPALTGQPSRRERSRKKGKRQGR